MPQFYDFDLISLGSGPAGQRAAIQAAKLGKQAAIVERRQTVGGVCVATGTSPSKTFREAVLSFMTQGSLLDGNLDHQFKGRPTAEQLFRRVNSVIQRETQVVQDQLWRNDVQLLRGEASFIDPHTLIVASPEGSRRVTADKIVIAVGTQPAVPPGINVDLELILTALRYCTSSTCLGRWRSWERV